MTSTTSQTCHYCGRPVTGRAIPAYPEDRASAAVVDEGHDRCAGELAAYIMSGLAVAQ
ncbi:hypothetical protein GXW83_09895 [Streptacidiphilus sp. PB12-B1b]|uniref:hypothetical protein n=1 Tax=Streptacidiphilus sp. PB12-B1b TaxID=2705012 RepID=UPI0015FAEC0B|nr:hypothetical protein [Streptacidiphilus sp. PB12-B1b]QMU76002.1 hypothetical protein GXW83_09895 [Streptacidiphilus sp. PB12-B1b]